VRHEKNKELIPIGSIIEHLPGFRWIAVPFRAINRLDYYDAPYGFYFVLDHVTTEYDVCEAIMLTPTGDLIRESMGYIALSKEIFRIHK